MGIRDAVAAAASYVAAKAATDVTRMDFGSVPQYNVNGDVVDMVRVRDLLGQSPAQLYRTQPHLRTVVSFIARNVAQLGLPMYERVSDGDRRRLRDDPAALLIANPNRWTTRYELIDALVSDRALYDIAYWQVTKDPKAPSGWRILPIRAQWVTGTKGGTVWEPDVYVVQDPGGGRPVEIPADQVLVFHGWDPIRCADGYSPAHTLKEILAEQVSAQIYRNQRWRRGGRIGHVLTRPAGVKWSDTARLRFMESWREKFTGSDGTDAGGTPILEDGMTISKVGFTSVEDQYVENTKLALSTVAGVYHINPTMIGILDNANYSNVREFRRMLYGDSLGPILAELEDRINAFLLPLVGAHPDGYVEFNIGEKLQGSFEEQAAVMQTATGTPWMTANEARGKQNLPAVDGGDVLARPLNLQFGDAPAPVDSAPKALLDLIAQAYAEGKAGPGPMWPRDVSQKALAGKDAATIVTPQRVSASAKAAAEDHGYPADVADVLRTFFGRQRATVLSALGGKAEWWDARRWDRELAADLHEIAMTVTAQVGADVTAALGFNPDGYNPDQTAKFLQAVATSRAGMINSTTRDQIQAALSGDDGAADDPAAVFDEAEGSRADSSGVTLATTFAGFATTEAATQAAGDAATKTWIVTSANPRPEHAAMNGETVPIRDTFSNGANWPGDPTLGADGVAGCQCDVTVEVP